MYNMKYQDIVNEVHLNYESDIDRLREAKKFMTHDQYIKYELETLQIKAHLESVTRKRNSSDKPQITFNLGDVEDFLRAVVQLTDYVETKEPYEYVEKKSKRFIEALKENLY